MDIDVQRMTPTALAFIGDAAETLYIRKRLAAELDKPCGSLHVACSKFVNAKAQAAAFDALDRDGFFTEAERDIARRAKNAHLHVRANASPSDYHRATALEAVIGYLEVTGDIDRQIKLLEYCYTYIRDSANENKYK